MEDRGWAEDEKFQENSFLDSDRGALMRWKFPGNGVELPGDGWWMSEKLDGVRAYWNGSNFYSRQGNIFTAPKYFTQDLPSTPLDGELWCGRGLFQKCVSIVKTKKKTKEDEWKFVTYLVFDAPSAKGKFEERLAYLKTVIHSESPTSYAAIVGMKKCTGLEHLKQTLQEVEKLGGEGLMLRQPQSSYEYGRSDTLLKVKTFHDEEALVIGHKKGDGRLIGLMGALNCVLPNGKAFDIGTGFSDEQRKKPPKIGAVVTFKYQELSNDGHPRFPVYLRERTDITWTDVCANAKTNVPKSSIPKVVPQLKKQHSILYSTIPSRDQATGEKLVTSDDEMDEEEAVAVKPAAPGKKLVCKYGNLCFRTNKDHTDKFDHPTRPAPTSTTTSTTTTTSTKATAASAPSATSVASAVSTKSACKWGAQCFLTNPQHIEKYSHPDSSSANVTKDTKSDEEKSDEFNDEVSEDEMVTVQITRKEWKILKDLRNSKDDGSLKRKVVLEDDDDMVPPQPEVKEAEQESSDQVNIKKQKVADASVQVCVYGANCKRKNPDHFKEYSHPPKNVPQDSK